MRKETLHDDYFFDNGYWVKGVDPERDNNLIIIPTEKWRMLVDTCLAETKQKFHNGKREMLKITIITPELIMKTIEEDKMGRTKRSSYKHVSPEEKLKRKQRRRELREARKLKDANRNSE